METLSKAVDSTRVDCSRKLAESETLHSDHTKSLEDNYLQLIDTLNTKLKVKKFPSFDIFAEFIQKFPINPAIPYIIFTKLS